MLAMETKFLKNEHQGWKTNRKMSIRDDQWECLQTHDWEPPEISAWMLPFSLCMPSGSVAVSSKDFRTISANLSRKPIFGHRNQNFFKMNIRGDRFDREMSIRGWKPMIFFWIWGLSLTPPNPPIFLRYGHQNFFGQSPTPMWPVEKDWGLIEAPWAELLDQTLGPKSLGHTVLVWVELRQECCCRYWPKWEKL